MSAPPRPGIRQTFRDNEAFLILCVQVGVLHIGQSLIVPILPLYAKSFAVGAWWIGFLLAMQAVPRVFANMPAGRLADQWGAHRLLALAAGIVTLSAIAGALAPNYEVLLLTRLVQGVGTAISQTAGLTYTANISRPENRARLISLFQGSFLLGNGIGPVIGGVTAQYFGYRAPFVLYALLAAVTGVWMLLRLPDPRTLAGGAAHRTARPGFLQSMRGLLGHSGVLLACLMGLLAAYTRAGSRDMALPLLGEGLGATEGQIGLALTVIFVANVAVLYVAGTLADRYGSKAVIVPSWVLTAVGLAVMAWAPGYGLLLVGSGVYGLAAGIGNPVPAVYIANAVEAEAQGMALGAFRTFNDIGLIIGPLVMGWTIERSGAGSGVLFNAALVGLIAVAFFILAPNPRHEYRPASVAPSQSKTGGD